ncbi:MAG: exodeoxyribonuclease VII small subunit [Acidimicrobiales bacterium]
MSPEELSALSFEQVLEELERITRQMASGDIGIEAVADLYEQAGVLHAEASARLDRVRDRIERLAEPAPTTGSQDVGQT